MEKINGLVLAEMIDLGSKNLAKNAEKINSLNVFPVPDGDTGTNMNLSMSSGAKETAAPPATEAITSSLIETWPNSLLISKDIFFPPI